MAVKTPFSKNELNKILDDYDLGSLQDFKPFERGADQTNILLITSKGRYAFRYYEKRSRDYVEYEIGLLHFLAQHSYPTPAPVQQRGGGYIGTFKAKPFALFEFMEGEHDDEGEHLQEVASVIAELHKLTTGFRPKHSESRATYTKDYVLEKATANIEKMPSAEEGANRLDWIKGALNTVQLPDDMPKGACHGDTNPGNFLYKEGKISAVLDFDQSSYTYLLQDVAHMIYWLAWPDTGVMDFDKAKRLLAEYQKYRPLTGEEKSHLFDMLKMVNLVSIGWFIQDDDFSNGQRKVKSLDDIGREVFYLKLFG